MRSYNHCSRFGLFLAMLLGGCSWWKAGAAVVLDQPAAPQRVEVGGSQGKLLIGRGWGSVSVSTAKGKSIGLVNPLFYACRSDKADPKVSSYWCMDPFWNCMEFVPLQETTGQDVLYVEGNFRGLKRQTWIAVYPTGLADLSGSTAFVTTRLVAAKGQQKGEGDAGCLGLFYPKEGKPWEALAIIVDGTRNPERSGPIDSLVAAHLKEPEVTIALLNPGSEFQKLPAATRHFGFYNHHPQVKYFEFFVEKGPYDLQEGDFLEQRYVLLWDDGDKLAEVEKLRTELPKLRGSFADGPPQFSAREAKAAWLAKLFPPAKRPAKGREMPLLLEARPRSFQAPERDWERGSDRATVHVWLDREVYDNLDRSAGAWLAMDSTAKLPQGCRLRLDLINAVNEVVKTSALPPASQRLDLDLDLSNLKLGAYRLRTSFAEEAGAVEVPTESRFRLVSRPTPAVVKEIPLRVANPGRLVAPARNVTMGVPFPKGALWDVGTLKLKDSAGNPVSVQLTPLGWCDRFGSVKWLLLDFKVPLAGKDQSLALVHSASTTGARLRTETTTVSISPKAPRVQVKETPESFTLITGPLKLIVPRDSGRVIGEAAVDINGDGRFEAEERIVSGGGPCLVDGQQVLHEAGQDKEASVVLEEKGDLKAVVRVESLYVAPEAKRQSKHITRLTCFAGQTLVKLTHTWVNTAATGEATFRDIGFALPLVGEVRQAAYGLDSGKPVLTANGLGSHLLQDTDEHFAVRAATRTLAEGKKAEGWAAGVASRGTVAVACEDFWQNFPKEIGVGSAPMLPGPALTFHVWPAHGVKHDLPVREDNLTKLWFVHEGNVLDFAVPPEVSGFDIPGANVHLQGFIKNSGKSNAIGLAKTHHLWVSFSPPSRNVEDLRAELLAHTTHLAACADPKWVVRTGAFGRLHEYDDKAFPFEERLLKAAADFEPRTSRATHDYGMWIYGHQHDSYDSAKKMWSIYRVWKNTHHGGPRWPWLMYVRSGDPDYLDYALANTRIILDTGFCHYSRPEFEKLAWPMGKVRGALCDYKGLVTWHSGNRTPDYNCMMDFNWWYYYMTGDARGKDIAEEWSEAVKARGGAGYASRSGAGTLSALLDLYAATFDRAHLPMIHSYATALQNAQAADGSFPEWENYAPWAETHWLLTGSERTRQCIVRWADAFLRGHGDMSENWGNYLNIIAYAYFATGDGKYLRAAKGLLDDSIRSFYDAPKSELHGNMSDAVTMVGYYLQRAPYLLEALSQAKQAVRPLLPRVCIAAEKVSDSEFQFKAFLEKPAQQEVALDLMGKVAPETPLAISARIAGPDGKQVLADEWTATRLMGHNQTQMNSTWRRLTIPASAPPGVYEAVLSAPAMFLPLCPLSEKAREVYPATGDGKTLAIGGGQHYCFKPTAETTRLELRVTGSKNPTKVFYAFDPEGSTVASVAIDTTTGSKDGYGSLAFDIPATQRSGVWQLFVPPTRGAFFQVTTGNLGRYFSVAPERFFEPSSEQLADTKR